MADKLLHERLRECVKNSGYSCSDLYGAIRVDNAEGRDCPWCSITGLNAICDDIERHYVPAPLMDNVKRFEVGKTYEGESDGKKWTVVGFGRGTYRVFGQDEIGRIKPLRAKWLKEIETALDANGKAISIGDEAYYVTSPRGKKVKVTAIHSGPEGPCGTRGPWVDLEDGYFVPACMISLEKPVFDLRDERICVGDEGYINSTGEKVKVAAVHADTFTPLEEFKPWVELENGSWNHADKFVHGDRDSLGRILYDSKKDKRAYYNEHIGHDVGLRDENFISDAVTKHLIKRAYAVQE